jgi:CPA1 family monovalent cation:H+ antiporter
MGVAAAQSVFLLLLFAIVVFAMFARKLETPYSIVSVIGGLLLAFVPGIPRIPLNPDVIFLIFLPPLLYGAAWNTSWQDFRRNAVSIALLAVGLVGFTVAVVAAVGPLLLPGFDWRVAFVLGAVVATTDSIAATSIARRLGLPKRIVDILEGESLVNDATGLLALEFGTAMVVYGQVPTVGSAILRLLYLSLAGILTGLLIARVVEWFESQIDDASIEIAISIFVPYSAYLAAELIHASGVLAVVSAGLYLGHKSSQFFSPGVRLRAVAVWDALAFILNGFVFVLIGLQLPYVLNEIRGFTRSELVLYGALFSASLILLRLAWTFPGAALSWFVRTRILHHREKMPGAKLTFIIGWTGMRGVIALAAAISLPTVTSTGAAFPHRSMIVFLTFSAILVTLVLQGLTLPPLVRALGLAGSPGAECEQDEARELIAEAALEHLKEMQTQADPNFAGIYGDLEEHYRQRLASLTCAPQKDERLSPDYYERYLDASRSLIDVERQAAIRLRREGRISHEFLRRLERELDLGATRLTGTQYNAE